MELEGKAGWTKASKNGEIKRVAIMRRTINDLLDDDHVIFTMSKNDKDYIMMISSCNDWS